MIALSVAAGLCLLTVGGLVWQAAAGGRLVLSGFDGFGVLAGFVAAVIAATAFGPLNGLSLVVALMLHEAGHVVGAWLAGRQVAEFRLLHAFTGLRPDDAGLERDIDRFMHALMGAGLSVAPMALAVTLALALAGTPTAGFFTALAISLALVNTVNLMPFHPLDGGRCIEMVARALSPAVLHLATATGVAAMFLAGYLAGIVALLALAAAAVVALLLRAPIEWRGAPMTQRQAGLAFAAYLTTLAAHLAGGGMLLKLI